MPLVLVRKGKDKEVNFEDNWLEKIQEIKERLKQVPGMEREIQLQCGAVAQEAVIDSIEARLGIPLPPSFRFVVENVGSFFYFSFFLNDFILPDEFSEIFSGGLSWDIDSLEFINEVNGEFLEETEDDEESKLYIQHISHMLRFADSGNGDIYVFDMSAVTEEKPVLYWDHETGGFTYLASSFQLYIEFIAELNFIGDEIWQFESFLDIDGLNPSLPFAKRWKSWFESLLENRLETKKHDLKSLFAYTLTRKKWDKELKEAFGAYQKEEVFQMIRKKLAHTENEDVKEMLATMIMELIGTSAEEWVETLWENIGVSFDISHTRKTVLSSGLVAKISPQCMDEEKAFKLLSDYLENSFGDKITGDSAYEHLKYFSGKFVIPWMEQKNIISIHGWDRLLMSVASDWKDLLRWCKDNKMKKVVIDGLALFVQDKEGLTAPFGLPDKESVIEMLNQLEEKELLKTRKKKIELVLNNINLLYEKDF